MLEESPVVYHGSTPPWLAEFCAAPELRRLGSVGMNCGCEYTAFPRFLGLPRYSRLRHSVGVCLITWHFTERMEPALAALFHDISTPVFAHTVDFLHGDYLRQEYTEGRTADIIKSSPEIMRLLGKYGVEPDAVTDYHVYPIADNDSPRLSADRLEYTLGNLAAFGLRGAAALQEYYDDIAVTDGGGAPELAFRHKKTALAFGLDALKTSAIYISPEDRYAMQCLSELLHAALKAGVLSAGELYGTEDDVISRICANPAICAEWERYRALHRMLGADEAGRHDARWRVIPAKKRCIDPLVIGMGRLSTVDEQFASALGGFLAQPLDAPICAV